MAITDELREYVSTADRDVYTGKLLAIADRIDAAHEEAIQHEHESAYDKGYQNGENAILAVFDKRGDADVDETMAEHGWYRALDADKEPIHLGDEVYQVGGGWVYMVESITFYPDNATATFSCKHGFGCDSAHNVRHYHTPTVEDVLREFTDAILEWSKKSGTVAETGTWSEVAAEYAAKLRLADNGKEQ